MRAARAASGRSKKVTSVASSRHAESQRPPSPDHKTTRSPLINRRESTLSAKATKVRRVPRGSASKRTRAGARVAVQNDAASRFPIPYPGFGAGRPASVSSPFLRMRQYHHSESRSPERAGARHTKSCKVLAGDSLGEASVRLCHKKPRPASEELSRRVVTGRQSAATPRTSSGRTTTREYSLPVKAFDPLRLALAIQERRERSKLPAREERLHHPGSNRMTKRPTSAPPRRGEEFSQSGEVLKALSRMADIPHSPPELHVMKWVLLRETYITKLQGVVPAAAKKRSPSPSRSGQAESLTDSTGHAKLFGLLTELLTVLRRITVEIVEAVERWRRGGHAEQPFIWGSSNYLLKAASDTSFLALLPGFEKHIGVTISNNPFFCHVDLDGRSTHLSSRGTKDDQEPSAELNKSAQFPFSGLKSLGVSAKRVKAAAAVLHREVLRAQGVQTAIRSNSPTRLKQSRSRRQAGAEWDTSCGGQGHESLRTSQESCGKPPIHNARENRDCVVYTQYHISGKERSVSHDASEGRNVSDFGGMRPIENDPKAPFCEGRDLPPGSTVGFTTLPPDDENIDSRFRRYPDEENRKLDGTCGNYPYQQYSDCHGYPYEDYRRGEQPTQRDRQECVGYYSKLHEGANNLATRSADDERPVYDYTEVRHQEHIGHADEEPLSLDSNVDPGHPERGERIEQLETGGEHIPSVYQKPTPEHASTGSLDATQSPEAADRPDPQDEKTCGKEDSRESTFMTVFDMCDGMLTNLQCLSAEGKAVELPREGALGADETYSFSVMPSEGKYLEQGGVPWKPVRRESNTSDRVRASGKFEVNEDELPCGAAYERQTKNLNAASRSSQNAQKNAEQEEDDEPDWLRCKEAQDTLLKMFIAWADKTEARLNHRIENAVRHYRRGMIRRAMTLWEARWAQTLGARMAEAFAGRFGQSRVFVQYAFNALRAHAKGARIAARNRSNMETVATRLEYVGKMRLRLALHQWVRSLVESGKGNNEALTQLGKLRAKYRMAESFEKLRPPSEVRQTRRAKGKLAGSLAGAFMAAVSTSLNSAEATQLMKDRHGLYLGTTEPREDSRERWMGDDESVTGAPLSEYEAERQEKRRNDRHSGGSTVSARRSKIVADQPTKLPQGTLDGLKAMIQVFRPFRPPPDTVLANETVGVIDKQLGKRISPDNAAHHHATAVLRQEAAANRIQHVWRVSQEKNVVARVANSVSLIRKICQTQSRRRRAGVRAVRAWHRRTCLRARTLDRALIEAASAGDLRAVTFLLRPGVGWKTGADVNGTADYGLTALHAVCLYVEGSMVSQGNSSVEPEFRRVSADGDMGLPNERGKWGLTDRPDWNGVIRALVEAGAPVESKDWKGFTPMMSAAAEGDGEMVATLAAFGAEVDAVAGRISRRTPLVIAAQKSNVPTMTTLLEYGAKVNLAAVDGLTPLHEAVGAGSFAVAEILVRAGANVNATSDSGGVTPLHLAIANDQHAASRLLVHSGANVCQPDARGITPLRLAVEMGDASTVALLLSAEPPTDLSVHDENGGTILHAACKLGSVDIARLLLDAGADPHMPDAQGKIPKLVALDLGHTESAYLFYQTEIRSFVPQERDESVITLHGHGHESKAGVARRELTTLNAEKWHGEEYTLYKETEAQPSDHRSSRGGVDQQDDEKGVLDADRELGSMHEGLSGALATARDPIGVRTEGYQVSISSAATGDGAESYQHERQEPVEPAKGGVRYEELVEWSLAENLTAEGRALEGHEVGVDDEGEWEWSDTEGWRARQRGDDPWQKELVLVKGEDSLSFEVHAIGQQGEDHSQRETELHTEREVSNPTTDKFRGSVDDKLQTSQTQIVKPLEEQTTEDERESCDDNKHVEQHVHFYPRKENKGGFDGYADGEDAVVPDHEGNNHVVNQSWEEHPEPVHNGRGLDGQQYALIVEGDVRSTDAKHVPGERWSNTGHLLVQDGSSVQQEVARTNNRFGREREQISGGDATISKGGSNAWSMASGTLRIANTWISFVDRESGYLYYQNQESGETQWEPPPDDDIVLIASEHGYGDATVVHS